MTVVTVSEGIGYALAAALPLRGSDLIRSPRAPVAHEAAERIRAQGGGRPGPRDVTSPRTIAAIETRWRPIGPTRTYWSTAPAWRLQRLLSHPPEAILRLLSQCARLEPDASFSARHAPSAAGGVLNLASLGRLRARPIPAGLLREQGLRDLAERGSGRRRRGRGGRAKVFALAPGPLNTGFHRKMGSERAFYRYFVVPASAEAVAAAGYRGFAFGWRVIVLRNQPIHLHGLRCEPWRGTGRAPPST